MTVVTLDQASIDAVAERVAELLRGPESSRRRQTLLTVAEVADRIGFSRDYVYNHAAELGGVKLGEPGPGKDRRRWRFDPARVDQARGELEQDTPTPRPPRRPKRTTPAVELLPVGPTRKDL